MNNANRNEKRRLVLSFQLSMAPPERGSSSSSASASTTTMTYATRLTTGTTEDCAVSSKQRNEETKNNLGGMANSDEYLSLEGCCALTSAGLVSEGRTSGRGERGDLDDADDADDDAPRGSGQRLVAAVVCNRTLPTLARLVLQRASFVIAADGGANRLYDDLPGLFPDADPDVVRRDHAPHRIVGDLDSIRGEVRSFYTGLGVPVVDLSHDQDSTDLMKCLDLIVSERGERVGFSEIVALGTQGGRLDHTLLNLSILHAYRHLPLLLMGDGNLTRLVPRGKFRIHTSRFEGPKCGLIPLAGRAVASSRGLRWNLDRTEMRIGGLISSCNEIMEGEMIVVETDADLVWTIELHERER